MKLVLIAAHDPNLVIGKDGDLPWHYPEDMKHFKETTMGYPVLMGRGEFEELGEKPLPGRENVVLSRSRDYDHVPAFNTIDKALEYLKDFELVYVIGGGEIYRQTIGRADKLVITKIHKEYEGDTFFPEYRDDIGTKWRETNREEHGEFTIVEYERI
ncbi:dihydrofolate reductase [Halalkalibaculum sp. DA3122]|uniref:dihydrofolate reductase n=1 Tax=unclassified Halalkalibaculum TaxID=2964617 RepID=UPI0037547CE4